MAYNRGNVPQPQDTGAFTLSHRDIHPGNRTSSFYKSFYFRLLSYSASPVVFGNFVPSGPEHHIFPVLKLIDFGRSALGGDPEDPDLYDIYTDEEYRKYNDAYTTLWKLNEIFKHL